ncbi:ankyrin-1-like [Strongylocentrotus purpuratus]|uniref:Uncharacterized protein n=1 Tax=Strongylocentrotus purpuratus TaxID=7668 RepID=A0A7M7HKD1_STRPU|nr:ankyrin-1-like [Strongylocentrotus purpuratus]|eukprot:XP_011667498.1 PREDICTED: ankyrin-1-like [Strongylocentrotus purpuratus]
MIPLHGAAAGGHMEVMEYLIQQGSSVNEANAKGWTPFNAAVQEGHIEAVKYLMTIRAKQNRYDGMTPLYLAARLGHLDIVKFFISKGAGVNEEDDRRMIPLHGAAAGGHMEVMEYLIQQGSDLNKNGNDGWTPLHAAISNGHLEVVNVLFAEGAQGTRFEGLTLLYIASRYDHVDVVKFLVSKGCDVNEKSECGKSPLHAACYTGNMNIVKLLVHHKANVNEQDRDGWKPLEAAAQEGHRDVVDYLALNGVHVNVRDIDGSTPLQKTANADHLNAIKVISPCRGDPGEKDTRDPRSRGSQKLIEGEYVTVTMKDADTRSHTRQLAIQVDNVEDKNDCNQADNAKRGDDELSLKNIPIGTHDDKESGREEHNPFIHAKLKYPEKGEQDPVLDQIEAMKSPVTTTGADGSTLRGHQTWQYSGFDPPHLQTMETDGHPSEEPKSRCHSLIDENTETRVSGY